MYVLHYFPDTASLAPRMVLAELGVQHRCALIDREAGVLSSPAYRALHPLGQIPALETPDGPMFETAAILLYLADRHPGLAPAPDAPARAAFLSWLFFTSTNIHTTLLQLFYPDRSAGQLLHLAAGRLADLDALAPRSDGRPPAATFTERAPAAILARLTAPAVADLAARLTETLREPMPSAPLAALAALITEATP